MLVNRHKLRNGLRIVHHFNQRTGNVTLNMLYGAGSRNETGNKTGLAHLLEHLMFCGSKNIPDFDAPLEKIGGTSNAYTTCDITNYYLTLPNENVETGFWLESDRMLNPNLGAKSFNIQKQVVLEEFKQGLNEPYGEVQQMLKSLCYTVHPYSHDTIGLTLGQVNNLTLPDAKAFFKKYYHPANAVLSVTGNVEWDNVLQLSEKWFGNIPGKRSFASDDIAPEPIQTSAREATRFADVPQNSVYKAYHICNCIDDDFFICDLLSDILANGKSARLRQALVYEQKLFSTIDAYVGFHFDPGLLVIAGRLCDNVLPDEGAAAIDAQTRKLCEETVPESELEKCKNKYEMNALTSRFDMEQTAADLALYELIGRPDYVDGMVGKYCKTTPEEVLRVARKIFRPANCNTLYYLKK